MCVCDVGLADLVAEWVIVGGDVWACGSLAKGLSVVCGVGLADLVAEWVMCVCGVGLDLVAEWVMRVCGVGLADLVAEWVMSVCGVGLDLVAEWVMCVCGVGLADLVAEWVMCVWCWACGASGGGDNIGRSLEKDGPASTFWRNDHLGSTARSWTSWLLQAYNTSGAISNSIFS
ncbi:hypothetical protein HNY73_008163 [Argiope bruennichi]|uniref:Uncharacterized protein n=1 Tax=Argiope bruennichi TaxID=94029 RepID=A0A8T0F7Z2_ARGBR|nr:hypothetical protein HNY73_008163 [Argiope bruennichi]